MISLYSGTPGSGKSYHMAYKVYDALKYHKQAVISNTPINLEALQLTGIGYIKKRLSKLLGVKFRRYNQRPVKGEFVYMDETQLTPEALRVYASEHFRLNVEHQGLIVIDEAALKFNSRAWNMKDRQDWVKFFQTHRHYGYDVILVCQHERMLDRQIRAFLEYDFIHRRVKSVGLMGFILSLLLGGNAFAVIQTWCGCRVPIGRELLRFRGRIASIYDSYAIF